MNNTHGSIMRTRRRIESVGRRRGAAGVGAVVASLALVLAGCGSSSNTGSSQSSSAAAGGSGSATTGGSQTGGAGSASSASAKGLMSQLVAQERDPGFTPPGPPIDVKKLPKSTGIVVIDNTPSVGPLQEGAAGAMAAAKSAGFSPKLLNGGANNTPSADIQLLEQAVNLHPKAVIQVGIITNLETAGIQYAKAHGVPVIAVEDDQPKAGAPGGGSGAGIAGTTGADYSAEGADIADYIAAKGPSNAVIGMITSDDIVSGNDVVAGFKSRLAKVCPHCTVISSNVDTASWTTNITPTITSMLDAHSDMNYLFPSVDGMVPWVTPALTASSHKLPVLSVNATPGAAMAAVASGQFAAESGASATEQGWYAVDAALRAILKEPMQTNPNEPVSFFTTSEMKAKHLDPSSPTSLFGDSFQAGFLKLWGLR